MKTVVNSAEVFHLWAHQSQSHARGNGSVSFQGKDAYSYSAIIGRIVENEKGETAYLVSNRNYSVTTNKHQSMLRSAIPRGALTFSVYDVTRTPSQNLEWMLEEIPELAAKAKRARTNKDWKLNALKAQIQQARDFAEFFSLPMPSFDAIEESDLDAQIEAARVAYQEEIDRRNEAETERLKKWQETQKEHLALWLKGEVYSSIGLPFQYLRIASNGEEVETTNGARVPLDHVIKAAPLILRVLDSGLNFTPTTEIRLGHYRLNSIKDGIVTIGCHRFEAEEIRRFAEVLNNLPAEEKIA